MKWSRTIAVAFLAAGLAGGVLAWGQSAEVNRNSQREEATLEEQLNSGLKVRTASERAFTARVAKVVQEGQLSESLVKAIFQRARAAHSRYPLPYFSAMIRPIARQRGVEL